jgi:hypothetical protein
MRRRITLWLALGALATATAVGAAAAIGPPHTDPVTATFSLNRTLVLQQRTCTGVDGEYRAASEVFTGLVTGDARLSGAALLAVRSLTNTTTDRGTFDGTLVVRDPATQQVKVSALVTAVRTNVIGQLHGMIQGLAADSGSSSGGRLVANFQAYGHPTALVGGIGISGDAFEPGLIQGGSCAPSPSSTRPAT